MANKRVVLNNNSFDIQIKRKLINSEITNTITYFWVFVSDNDVYFSFAIVY